MRRLLSTADYASSVEQLQEAESDAKNLLDFILFLLRHRRLQNSDTGMEINERARRFMTKVFIRMPVKPPSLALNATEINMPPDWWTSGYVGGGGFANVFKGKYRGQAVAVKELRKYDASHDLVSSSYRLSAITVDFCFPVALLSRGVNMAIPQAQIHSTFFRNLRA